MRTLPWLFSALVLGWPASPSDADDSAIPPLVVASGQKGGLYHTVGEAIVEVLGGGPHQSIASQGTVDNLRSLYPGHGGRPQADLAIVQSDVLHRLLQRPETLLPEIGWEPPRGGQEVKTILALFPEYVQAVVRRDSTIRSFHQLDGRLLFLGSPNSGSRLNALDLLQSVNPLSKGAEPSGAFLETSTIGNLLQLAPVGTDELNGILHRINEPPHDPETDDADRPVTFRLALELLKAEKIDAAFTTQGALVDDPALRHLHLREDAAREFRKRFDYYGIRPVQLEGEPAAVAMPFVRATLVARGGSVRDGGLSSEAAREIARLLYAGRQDLERRTVAALDAPVEFFVGDRMVRRITDTLHPGARSYFKSVDIIARVTFAELLFVVPLLLIGLTFLGNSLRDTRTGYKLIHSRLVHRLYQPESAFQKCWDRYRSWICGSWIAIFIWLFLILFVLVVYFIRFVEKQESVRLDIENPFAGASFWETAFWMATFAATGFNQNIYPNTMEARILAVLVPLAGLLVTLFVLVTQTFRSARESERRAQGLLPPPALKDHVLICGWNERIPLLLSEMCARSSPLFPRGKVVVVAETDEEKPLERLPLNRARIHFYRGKASDPETLERVHASSARSAVVLADNQNLRDHNARSILATLALAHGLGEDSTGAPKALIAELFFEGNRRRFEHSGALKLVSLPVISGRVISHALLNPGVSGLVVSLLRFSNSQVLRRTSARDLAEKRGGIDLSGLGFWEAFRKLRTTRRQLLAIYRTDRAATSDAIEIEFGDPSPYLMRAVGEEAGYEIRPDDGLVYIEASARPPADAEDEEWRFLRRGGTPPPFRRGSERVLLVGNGSVGDEVARVLAARSERVVWVVSAEANPGETSERGPERREGRGVTKLGDNLIRLESAGALDEAFFLEHRDHFAGATRAVLLGSDRSISGNCAELNQDDATLLLAMTLRKLDEFDGIHIAAEMRSRANLPLFHEAGIDQPIPTMAILEQALVQMAFHRGVATELLLKSMSYSPANRKCRLVRMSAAALSERAGSAVFGLGFDALAEACAEVSLQLVAIHSTKRIEEGGFPVIVNPPVAPGPKRLFGKTSVEAEAVLSENDYVFVFDDPAND